MPRSHERSRSKRELRARIVTSPVQPESHRSEPLSCMRARQASRRPPMRSPRGSPIPRIRMRDGGFGGLLPAPRRRRRGRRTGQALRRKGSGISRTVRNLAVVAETLASRVEMPLGGNQIAASQCRHPQGGNGHRLRHAGQARVLAMPWPGDGDRPKVHRYLQVRWYFHTWRRVACDLCANFGRNAAIPAAAQMSVPT
jgi:hypothetical protein